MATKTYWITRNGMQKAKITKTKNVDEYVLLKQDGLMQYSITGNIEFIRRVRDACNKILEDDRKVITLESGTFRVSPGVVNRIGMKTLNKLMEAKDK